MAATDDAGTDRSEELEERFAAPVAIAAIAAVPAVFLTMMEGWPSILGEVVNSLSLTVFAVEFVVLFWAAEDKRRWLWEHKFLVGVFVAAIPAVLLFVGGAQVLRLLRVTRSLGAMRIARVRRIVKAARKIGRAAALTGTALRIAQFTILGSAALFVAIVLADPDSQSRRLLEATLDAYGVVPVVSAAVGVAILVAAVFYAFRSSGDEDEAEEAE